MPKQLRFSANIGTFNACADRFVPSGYSDHLNTDQLIKAATQVSGLTGVELVGGRDVNDGNLDLMRHRLKDEGLTVSCVTPNIWGARQWARGSFTALDLDTRRKAVEETKQAMDLACQLDCKLVNLWLGQDGFDYPFQSDYVSAWDHLIEGIQESAEYNPKITLVLEYKPKEPRNHCYISTVGNTLMLIEKVAKPNVGAMIDTGHALEGYENIAESVAMLHHFGNKLFYMHFNDNWRLWDDDLTVGSIHTIEMLETIYWLDRIDYGGWYALDIFPYRENGIRAASESIRWIQGLSQALERVGRARFTEVIASGDAMNASALLRETFLPA